MCPAIESTGVPLRSRDDKHRYFRPPSDQPRVVQIHVCDAGGTWERDHIAFRDHLRNHPDVAAAYGRLKMELATLWKDDRYAYTDAKTAFILDVLEESKRTTHEPTTHNSERAQRASLLSTPRRLQRRRCRRSRSPRCCG